MAEGKKPKLPKKPPIQTVDIALSQDSPPIQTTEQKPKNVKKLQKENK